MKLLKNVRTYYFYSVFAELLILSPIYVMYLTKKGLTFTEIMSLQSISTISIFLFGIPTGIMAHKISGKSSILLGTFLWIIGLLIYALGNNFITFAIAEITFNLGSTFKSGIDSALIYDSLKASHRVKDYQRIEGRARSFALYGQAFGSIISSFVYKVNMYLPIIISIVFMIISAAITLFFIEPHVVKEERKQVSYIDQVKDSSKYIMQNEKLKAIVLFTTIFYVFYKAGYWYYQPYMESVNIPVKYFGILFFIFNITAALFSNRSHYIMDKTKPRTLTLMLMLFIISFIIMGLVPHAAGVFAILLQQVSRGIYNPVTTKYLNKQIPSDKRSTILSFQSLSCNLALAVAYPFLGILKDHSSIYATHLALAGIMAFLMIFVIHYMNSRLGVKFKTEE